VRIVEIKLKPHIPSRLAIAGNDTIITYEGQPPTFFRCNETGHLQIEGPRRNRQAALDNSRRPMSWADMVANTSRLEKPELATKRSQVESVRETENTGGQRKETTETEQGVNNKRFQETPENSETSDYHMAIENEVPNSSNIDSSKREAHDEHQRIAIPLGRKTMEDMHFACKMDPGATTGSNTLTDEEMSVQSGTLGEPVVMAELTGRPITYGNHGRGENSEAE